MTARIHRRLIMATSVFALAITAACSAPSMQNVRANEPQQCKMDERYICIGKSASRLDTDSDTKAEFCQCARLSELPQMGPGGRQE